MYSLVILSVLLACESGTASDGAGTPVDSGAGGDDTGLVILGDEAVPEITHVSVSSPQSAAGYVDVFATITDDSEVLAANIYFRRQVTLDWSSAGMSIQGPDSYLGVMTPDDLSSAGMHYYIEAVDVYGNVSRLPAAAPADYFKFDLVE